MTVDKDLEDLLVNTFRVRGNKAVDAAKNFTLAQFDGNFTRLDGIIGTDAAIEVVRGGDFLSYKNSVLEEYFSLAVQARRQINDSYEVPPKFFYSISSLKAFLGLEKEHAGIDASKLEKLDISKYRLLHKDNEQSRVYLNSLIEKGSIRVSINEPWGKGDKTGTRGGHILQKIAFELTLVFNELGLGRPEFELYYGQRLLIAYGETRNYLRKIRDKAYAVQR